MRERKLARRLKVSLLLLISLLSISVVANEKEKKSRLDISGYVMVDYDNFDSAFVENSEESDQIADIRRARLKFKSKLDRDWKATFKLDFANNEAKIKDAYVQYSGWKWADITLGKHKEPFSLEKLAGLRNSIMIERSITTQALAPGRSLGISASGEFSSFGWQLGYYQPDETASSSSVTGRAIWLPWQQKNNLLHLGVAFSERDLNGSEYRINEAMEVYFSDSLIEGKKLFAEEISLNGLELLWLQDRFTVMAEWQKASVIDTYNSNYKYQGGYIQFSYQLSGGHRKYKKGELGAVSKKGWEIATRYSEFELTQENEETNMYSLGVNYTINKKLKFMADIIHAERYEKGIDLDSGNAISLRMQYTF